MGRGCEGEEMRVRIKKARLPSYWYADKIGEIFDVSEVDGWGVEGYYIVLSDLDLCIDIEDAEVVNEEVKTKPPLGIEPRNIWVESRIVNLAEAICRYVGAGNVDNPVVLEWAEDIVDLIKAHEKEERACIKKVTRVNGGIDF